MISRYNEVKFKRTKTLNNLESEAFPMSKANYNPYENMLAVLRQAADAAGYT